MTNYIRLSSIPDAEFVLSKLAGTLAAIFEKPDAAWGSPCRHTLGCIVLGKYVRQDKVPPTTDLLNTDGVISFLHIKSLLRLALSIVEGSKSSLNASKQ